MSILRMVDMGAQTGKWDAFPKALVGIPMDTLRLVDTSLVAYEGMSPEELESSPCLSIFIVGLQSNLWIDFVKTPSSIPSSHTIIIFDLGKEA